MPRNIRPYIANIAVFTCMIACSAPSAGWPPGDTAADTTESVGTGSLAGRIRNTAGDTVADAAVTTSPLGYETRADAEGGYSIGMLPEGDYQIVVQADGYATTWSDPATVHTDQATPLDLTLADDLSVDEERD